MSGYSRHWKPVNHHLSGIQVRFLPFLAVPAHFIVILVHRGDTTENINTTTSGDKLIFHIFGALAEFERNLIRERTQAGLVAARARGRIGGRPKALSPQQQKIAQALYDDPTNSIPEICRTLKISKVTLYRYVKTEERDR
jgi:DNA invertase Pin-like site-specific DNA recombinase